MKIILKILFATCLSTCIKSQGVNNLWLMGYDSPSGIPWGGTNIDFTSGVPNIYYTSRPMNIRTTNSNISNSNGNLLFYSNGIYIANTSNDTMMNGSGLNPSAFTTSNFQNGLTIAQGNLIIPFPGDSTKYYLFHETVEHPNGFQPLHLYYSTIDMTLDNGLGSVIIKNDTIINDTLTIGEITACKHANGRDWWVFAHKYQSKRFYKLLVTPNGIQTYTQNIGTKRNAWGGQSVFSPDGNRFAHYNPNTDLDVYDFNRCTGQLSNFRHVDINDSMTGGGVAFSPNSNVLYVSSILYVYQFDASISNIASTQTTVAVWDSFYSPGFPFATTFFLSQIAPDGKIYINCSNGTDYLHVINNPDSLGLTCNVCQHCVQLPTYNAFTIPNHPNYFLGSITGSICDSLTTIDEVSNDKLPVKIFPNPSITNAKLIYTLPDDTNGSFIISNAVGQTVAQYKILAADHEFNFETEKLSQGVYYYKILAQGNLVDNGKLVIIK